MARRDLEAVADRFWAKVDIVFKANGVADFSKCWPWNAGSGSGANKKYGKFWLDGRMVKAHRIAFMLHYRRKIPKHLDGAHTCDNPPCCNPTHIRPASHRANVQEWYFRYRAKGKQPRPAEYLPLTDTERIA
jgi:hypothetical protein